MAQCRDLENHHHEKLLEISINTLEKIVKGELEEDLPDGLRAVRAEGRGGAPGRGGRGTGGDGARRWRARGGAPGARGRNGCREPDNPEACFFLCRRH